MNKNRFNSSRQGPAINDRINPKSVRVISEKGEMGGVLETREAIKMAFDHGLDLVQVSPNASPPVCKIIDYGKYKYEIQKKASQAKKKQKVITLKELKMRPSTDKHDYDFKMKNAKKFLSKGDKVKFTIRFKGREMDYMKAAYDLIDKIIEDTKDISKVEQQAKLEGRQMTLIIQPN